MSAGEHQQESHDVDATPSSTLPAATDAPPPPPLNVDIALEFTDRVNFAMQQNGVALVEAVAVTNRAGDPLTDLAVDMRLDNDECEPWQGRIDRIEPGTTYTLPGTGLTLSARQMATRTEAERTALEVTVASAARQTRRRFDVDLLAFDQWPGVGHYPELTAAFITPNHPRIAEFLAAARTALGASTGQDALDGYQSGSRRRAAAIAEACYNALATRQIGYINPPASFEKQGQRVRLVDRVVREGFGTCLDLTLLLAAMWEQAGLHPVILLPEGHAMPAVWTHEAHLPEPAIDEAARIRNLVELGELVPMEATLVTQAGTDFAAAVAAAQKRLTTPGSGFCAIDVRTCRKRGVRPLPLRDDGEATAVDLTRVETAPAPAGTSLDPVALAERAEAGEPAAPTSTQREAEVTGDERIRRWQTRLLDLSLRNRLLNFRATKKTLALSVPDAAALEDRLSEGGEFSLLPRPALADESSPRDLAVMTERMQEDALRSFLVEEMRAGRLHGELGAEEHERRLVEIFRHARTSLEETGANTLYLA
ncbi:MAG: DUF4011 domain-containing protein, partial [Phycisphaerales bacterium]|nr:DUF4011 domain-containing protein [Phycisphaerales bacterium]